MQAQDFVGSGATNILMVASRGLVFWCKKRMNGVRILLMLLHMPSRRNTMGHGDGAHVGRHDARHDEDKAMPSRNSVGPVRAAATAHSQVTM